MVRHLARDRVRVWLGRRLDGFELNFASYGIWYVIGLRLVGTPHFLVTTGSALMPIRPWTFAGSTLLGLLPAIAIAAAVRADVRQLKVTLENLTIQQQAVELAFKQLESAYEVFTAPQVPDNSPNAAAQAAL